MNNKILGIISALKNEISWIFPLLKNHKIEKFGLREYHIGNFQNTNVVITFSHYGKVSCALTTTTLITKYNINEIIFFGTAGAIKDNLNIGDVILGKNFYQYDIDASPIIKQFMLPFQKKPYIECNQNELIKAKNAISKFLLDENLNKFFDKNLLNKFNINTPKLFIESIATGDKLILNTSSKQNISHQIPDAYCVDMESSAVAQVCHDFNIPFTIIRIISDKLDNNSKNKFNFNNFLTDIISIYSSNILTYLLTE